MVHMAAAKSYRLSNVYNHRLLTLNGLCSWNQLHIGGVRDIQNFVHHLRNNYHGYKVVDQNTTESQQIIMHYHVDSMVSDNVFINGSNCKCHIEIYEVEPRADIHGTLEDMSPVNLMLSNPHSGELFDNEVVDEETPSELSPHHPNYTPYMSPMLTQSFRITNTRKFVVHPGGRFDIKLELNNFDANAYVDTDYVHTNLIAKKGKYKAVLLKMYGELGIIGKDSTTYVRNLPCSIFGQGNDVYKGRIGEDSRVIYADINQDIRGTVVDPTSNIVLVEEQNANATVFNDFPNSIL